MDLLSMAALTLDNKCIIVTSSLFSLLTAQSNRWEISTKNVSILLTELLLDFIIAIH